MKYFLATGLILLSGCTVTIVDKRLTREEVVAAFAQRDDGLLKLAGAVQVLQQAAHAEPSQVLPVKKEEKKK